MRTLLTDGGRLRRAADRLIDLALPATCPGCGREGPPVCRTCAPALDARLDQPAGVPIGLPGNLPAPLLQLEWCAPYAGVARRALHRLKYGGERRLAEPLGRAIARRWSRVGAGGDLVVPVPVHAERARQRGYDQAALIAAVAAAELGRPMVPLLQRARATIAQFDLDRRERSTNVAGAFVIRPPAGARGGDLARRDGAGRPWLQGRWIVLVDDVVTTGSTLAACAEPLLRAGAIGVSAITVARER